MKLKVFILVIPFFMFNYFKIQSQVSGQNSTIKINWESNRYVKTKKGSRVEVFAFKGGKYVNIDIPLPTFFLEFPGKYLTKFEIYNETYQTLDAASQRLFPSNFNTSHLQATIDIQYQNKRPVSVVTFIPLRKNVLTGQFEKLISFQYKFIESVPEISSKIKRIYKNNSVLAQGNWYKLAVTSSGIYKIDYNFLSNIGINTGTINPQYISIFGNGGGMLPQANAAFRYDDLEENAIYVEGENNGQFNSNDYILFYAKGPHTWSYDSVNSIFKHTQNIYSDTAFYFLTIGSSPGLRINIQNSLTGGTPVYTFDDHFLHERDLVNLGKSGREWYGEAFDYINERDFNFDIPGLNNSEMKITCFVLGNSNKSSSFTIELNNSSLGNIDVTCPACTGDYPNWGINKTFTFTVNSSIFGNNSNITITLTYNKGTSSNAVGYLNYIEINTQRELQLYGNQTQFRSIESLNNTVSDFSIKNLTSGAKILDITDPLKPIELSYTLSNNTANFSDSTTTLKEYVVFSGSAFLPPQYVGKIQNQDLHSIIYDQAGNLSIPDLVIVTPSVFFDHANKLADFRESNDNLDVKVVTLNHIYNEFSSGSQDITAIRDFMKMLYDISTTTDSIRYLLLFGDASYDYKKRVSPNTNFVPVYESNQSIVQIRSYSSDDYFGFLDDSEGNWDTSENSYLDIGIGRLPVKNINEADDIVNKIINYSQNSNTFGKWRNKICFVADDGSDDNGSNTHIIQTNNLANNIVNNYPVYNVNKIYLDSYSQISTPGGERAPECNEAIDHSIENGVLIMNYTGHGGEAGWAHERILEVNQINDWENINNLTLFFTATCEFGRYDDPERTSAGEYTVLNPNGGAIAAITTTRPVYSGPNYVLNTDFYNVVFDPINGKMPGLGDIIRKIKNNGPVLNDRNFSLLGDPSMRLAYPEKNIVVTKINNKNISSESAVADTLKALSKITIEGEIRKNTGVKIDDFGTSGNKGYLYATIFDKPSKLSTLGNGSPKYTFKILKNIIYQGKASIKNGAFSFTFIVPKDISYKVDFGKISFYAHNDNMDANGVTANIVIGGSSDSISADNDPPIIDLYMDDESFVFGGITSYNTELIANLFDLSGINIAGTGIGHEITAILDNNANKVIDLNEYYTAKLDNFQEGTVKYQFKNLSEGNHSIRFKAWDTYNNSAESYIEFVVANNADIALKHVLNYPNPFSTNTTFHFDHNRVGDDLDIQIQIYTISGKLIKTINSYIPAESSSVHISSLKWNGRDDFGNKIGNGVYIYKVNIRSNRDNSSVFVFQKLVILN